MTSKLFVIRIFTIVFFSSGIFNKMNEDYQANLTAHNSQQDLAWWDQNYGM